MDFYHQMLDLIAHLMLVVGGVKKLFFLLSVKKLRPPSPPFLTTSVFSDKDFFTRARPPLFLAKNGKKTTSFSCKTPIFLANYAVVQTSDVVHLGVVYLGCSPNSGRPNVIGSPNGYSPNTLVVQSEIVQT